MTALFVDRSASDPGAEGKSLAQLAKERGVHPADVMCELAVADGLETQFLWNSRDRRRGSRPTASRSATRT